MKLFGFLSREKVRPTPVQDDLDDQPPERQAGGIDYLRAQAGLAEPVIPEPVNLLALQVGSGEPIVVEEPQSAPGTTVVLSIQWDSLCDRAEQANARGAWVEAEALWRVMRTGFPNVWFAYRGGAVALFNLGRHEEAGQLLADAAKRFPEERSIPLEQGRQAKERGDWPAAERYWRAALTYDSRPWWVYTELALALENQDRIAEAEAVLADARLHADEPDEITLFIYPARLAWKRHDWAAAAARWVEARRRFPHVDELAARQYDALMRLAEFDPAAYEATLRDLGLASPGDDKRDLMLRFESLGGTGPDGGGEFGCFQRHHGAEPLGLFRWASVSPANLIACLNARFAGLGEIDAITVVPHDAQWEVTDTLYGTKMQSFVSINEVSSDRMMALASKRMRYLKDKLLADLQHPAKIFVLKAGWQPVTPQEIQALSHAMRYYGPGELLCVCQSDPQRPAGTIVAAAPAVFIGYMDFFASPFDTVKRRPAWELLCRKMLSMSALNFRGDAA